MTTIAFFVMLLLQTAETTAPQPQQMTTGGWIFMAGAWLFILSLVYFTFSKVLRRGRK